jgi:hypothetical protein
MLAVTIVLGIGIHQFLADDQARLGCGERLGPSLLALIRPASEVIAKGDHEPIIAVGGVGVRQLLRDGRRLAHFLERLCRLSHLQERFAEGHTHNGQVILEFRGGRLDSNVNGDALRYSLKFMVL